MAPTNSGGAVPERVALKAYVPGGAARAGRGPRCGGGCADGRARRPHGPQGEGARERMLGLRIQTGAGCSRRAISRMPFWTRSASRSPTRRRAAAAAAVAADARGRRGRGRDFAGGRAAHRDHRRAAGWAIQRAVARRRAAAGGVLLDPWWRGLGRGEARFGADGRLQFSWPTTPTARGWTCSPRSACRRSTLAGSWEQPGRRAGASFAGAIVQILFGGRPARWPAATRARGVGSLLQGTVWTSWEMLPCCERQSSDPLLREDALAAAEQRAARLLSRAAGAANVCGPRG